jgi:hypothetical protein
MSNHFYFRTIWETITGFSEMFNDMYVYVYDKDKYSPTYGDPIGLKIVPVILAPKEKVVSVLNVLLGSEKPEVDNVLPKISILWSGISFEPNRERGKNQKRDLFVEYTTQGALNTLEDPNSVTPTDEDVPVRIKHYDIQTVPYKMDFELVIWAKYMDDGTQILEQILPFFAPDRQISLKERGIGIEREAKVVLNSITNNFTYDLNEPDRRILQWSLSFTCECNLYKPIYIDKDILKAVVRVGVDNPRRSAGDSITIAANGANIQGMHVDVFSKVQEFDQLTSSTAAISGNLHYMTIDTWANPPATFTPIDEPGSGILTVTLPDFNDEHNPPDKFEYPVSRHMSADYYNLLNPANPVTPDPEADEEFQSWKDDGSPGGG